MTTTNTPAVSPAEYHDENECEICLAAWAKLIPGKPTK